MVPRKIIHIDMDCFFAAVELRDRPELVGKPVAVGGSEPRGVLCTCNYEAREFGCRAGMPGFKARQLCPQIELLPVNFDKYKKESAIVHEIFLSYTDKVEPLSLDEAFLDVSHITDRYAWDLAKEIRQRIWEATGLTASAGVSCNKMLAKIASDWKKPNGQFAITPDQVDEFMVSLPVGKLWGVGRKTRERLQKMGIETCGDFQKIELAEVLRGFGKFGLDLYNLSRGIDKREVQPHRERKSMSCERTFPEDLTTLEAVWESLFRICGELREDLGKSKHRERKIQKIFVKLKFSDFEQTTCECAGESIDEDDYRPLLEEAWERGNKQVRLVGVGVRFAEQTHEEWIQMMLKWGETKIEL